MKKKKILLGFIGFSIFTLAPLAQANSKNMHKQPFNYAVKGFYANVDLGVNYNSWAWDVSHPFQFAWGADFGYQFNRYVGVEAGYIGSTQPSLYDSSTTASIYDVAAKGIVPINDKFSAYGKLGSAYSPQDGFGVLTALGVSYHINRKTTLNLGVTHIFYLNNQASTLGTVGIGYKFGL